jgi:hypothetical protein
MVGRHGRFDNGDVDRQRMVRWDVILTADRDLAERITTMDARNAWNSSTASKTCDGSYAPDCYEMSPFHIYYLMNSFHARDMDFVAG